MSTILGTNKFWSFIVERLRPNPVGSLTLSITYTEGEGDPFQLD